MWDLDSGLELRTLAGHSDNVYSVAVTADGRRAVSASRDNTLRVWGLDSGMVIAGFTCDGAASCCAFVGLDKIFAGDSGGRLYWLRLETQSVAPIENALNSLQKRSFWLRPNSGP